MKYIAESGISLCHLIIFEINGIKADAEEFVNKYDAAPEDGEEYGCGDMIADVIPASTDVLRKYDITEDEYYEIAKKVSTELSFGCCNWCV